MGIWSGSHEVGYFHCIKDGVDFIFVDHPGSFMRMGTPYGDANGEFGDNQFRFTLFTAAALEAPLQVRLCYMVLTGPARTGTLALATGTSHTGCTPACAMQCLACMRHAVPGLANLAI